MNDKTFVSFARKLARDRRLGNATRASQRDTRFINISLNDRASDIYVAIARQRRRIIESLMQYV